MRLHRLVVPKTWLWCMVLSLTLAISLWLGWFLTPVITTTGDTTEDPDITGLMMNPVFSSKNQSTGDTLTIRAKHVYHQEHQHYSLHQPQCHWRGDHGLITLSGQCGYWNHHVKHGSLWRNVVLRYHRKGHITTHQVNWDQYQRIWSHHPTQGRYDTWRFQSDGFVVLPNTLTLKGPARIQWMP